MSVNQLCRLLQLASPMLPVGAYSYSHGMEYAVGSAWIKNEKEAYTWIRGLLFHALGTTDLPVLIRIHRAFCVNDELAASKWNAYLNAMRETRELSLEDRQMGRALAKLLVQFDVAGAQEWLHKDKVSFASMYALAVQKWQIDIDAAISAYAWSWCENQVSAAMKLVPLGQTAGQQLLVKLSADIEVVVRRASDLNDEDIGAQTPGLAMASSQHEIQYTRIFRS